MKAKITLLTLIVPILFAASAYSKENVSDTRSARCMVKITADPDFLVLSSDTVSSLLNSTDVQDKTIRKIFNTSPKEFKGIFNVNKFVESPFIPTSSKKSIQFELNVALPDEIKPAAEEFMDALINNLRRVLLDGYNDHIRNLESEIDHSEITYRQALEKFKAIVSRQKTVVAKSTTDQHQDPQDKQVQEQMQQYVDLSALNPDMPLADAIEVIRTSVDPPLKIFVNWRDLNENAEINKDTPINADPISSIELGQALKLLLKSVSSFFELDYTIEKGIVIIATIEELPSQLQNRIYEVSPNVEPAELASIIQQTVEEWTWFDEGGEGTIVIHGNKLIIRQTNKVHKKINDFLQNLTVDVLPDNPALDFDELTTAQRVLQDDKRDLEGRVAALNAQQHAVEEQIERINYQVENKIKEDTVTKELQQLMIELEKAQDKTKDEDRLLEITEKIMETKVRLAERQQIVVNQARGDELAKLNGTLADLAISLAESRASLETVTKQLTKIKSQLRSTAVFDPESLQINQAKRNLELLSRNLNELKTRHANSRPPLVMVFGLK